MSDELERRLGDALDAEGQRARPRSDAWEAVAAGVGARTVPWLAVGSVAAAVVLVIGLLAVFVLPGDDPDTTEVITEPTVESTTSTSTPSTTSTSTSSTTSTTAPPSTGVVYAPIDMGPLPPTRSTPPDSLVAVQPDGTLVHVETATGRVLAEIADFGNLGVPDDPEVGMVSGIDGVALSPDGDTVWISVCCEPAAGSMWWTTISGPRTEQHFADSYAPAFGTSSSWATSATFYASVWDVRTSLAVDGHRRDWGIDDLSSGFHAATLSPDGSHLAVVEWGTDGRTGQLQIVDPSNTQERSPGFDVIVDESPLVVDGSMWAEPLFRRDGALLVAEHGPDIDPSWTPRLVDATTGALSDAGFAYTGSVLLDQDYDPSAEWLLYVVAPTNETLEGTLHWIGPNGQTGTVPGNFYAASW